MADNDFPRDDNEHSAAFDRVADLIATYKQFAAIVNDQLHDIQPRDDDDNPVRVHPAAGNVVNIVIYDLPSPFDDPGFDGNVCGDHFYCEWWSSQNRAHRPFFAADHHKRRQRPYKRP